MNRGVGKVLEQDMYVFWEIHDKKDSLITMAVKNARGMFEIQPMQFIETQKLMGNIEVLG